MVRLKKPDGIRFDLHPWLNLFRMGMGTIFNILTCYSIFIRWLFLKKLYVTMLMCPLEARIFPSTSFQTIYRYKAITYIRQKGND